MGDGGGEAAIGAISETVSGGIDCATGPLAGLAGVGGRRGRRDGGGWSHRHGPQGRRGGGCRSRRRRRRLAVEDLALGGQELLEAARADEAALHHELADLPLPAFAGLLPGNLGELVLGDELVVQGEPPDQEVLMAGHLTGG